MVRQVPPKTQLGVIKSNINQVGETIVPEIVYPESDGEPMADNTRQFTWIVKIKENLEILFKSNKAKPESQFDLVTVVRNE